MVYLPPPVDLNTLEMFTENVNKIISTHDDFCATIILGDFNLPSISWSSPTDHESHSNNNSPLNNLLLDFVNFNSLYQCNKIKNIKDNILDLILSNSNLINVCECQTPIRKVDPYHPPLDTSINIEVSEPNKFNTSKNLYNFFKADYKSIIAALDSIDWLTEFKYCLDNFKEMINRFYIILFDII